MSLGIKAIGYYIPEKRSSNLDKRDKFNIDDSFLQNKIGTYYTARKDDEQETSDLCLNAFNNLCTTRQINKTEIECIIVVTQNPDGDGLPHTSAIVHSKLELNENCAAFDISLGCSGFVYGLSVLTSFMASNGFTNGILFTADPYSKIVDPEDKNTSLLFGDAATATLISNDAVFKPLHFKFGTKGSDGEALVSREGVLSMDGRAVFNFSATKVPVQIHALLNEIHYSLDDIDVWLFHQGSKYIVDTLTRKLSINPEKVPVNIYGIGNTVSSSIPLLLKDYIDKKEVKKILISGFGVGLSWSSSVLERI
jgi:3-oxoacyl-[acyl-carrier-protein] synthase-3